MSKLISVNGYDIKISKKDIINKLEMISNDCNNVEYDWQMTDICYIMRDKLNRLNNNHGVVTNAINKCISFTFRSDGNVIGVSLKSNVNLTQCVEMLIEICNELLSRGDVEYVDKLLPNYRPDWFLKGQEVENTEPAEPAETTVNAEPVDYTKMSDNDLHDVVLSQLDYINRDLMETCVYNDLNGNGKYVHVGINDFMDVTPALTEFNSRFGITEIFCMIYRHYESRKTHVEYDSFDDTMYIVEVIPYDDDGNIIEYGYYVGDYYVRYKGITENIEIVEVEENETETENTNETKNEKEVKKAMKKTNRDYKVNGVNYTVVNNPNYNKEFAFEKSCMKYYAMKLLSTDGVTKSWVKTGIYGNTIDTVKEKITEWEDFNQYVENYDNTKPAEVENTEPVEEATKVEPVHLTIDNNTPDLIKSVIELEKLKNSDNVISEKSKEFLKKFNSLSKDLVKNWADTSLKKIIKNFEPAQEVPKDALIDYVTKRFALKERDTDNIKRFYPDSIDKKEFNTIIEFLKDINGFINNAIDLINKYGQYGTLDMYIHSDIVDKIFSYSKASQELYEDGTNRIFILISDCLSSKGEYISKGDNMLYIENDKVVGTDINTSYPEPVQEILNFEATDIEILKSLGIIFSNEFEEYNGEKLDLTKNQLEYFYNKVDFIKKCLGYDGVIVNGQLNYNDKALATYVVKPKIIVVDNSYIDDCYNKNGLFSDDDLTETICHEIAHDKYLHHGRWHSRLTRQLYEKVKEHELKCYS